MGKSSPWGWMWDHIPFAQGKVAFLSLVAAGASGDSNRAVLARREQNQGCIAPHSVIGDNRAFIVENWERWMGSCKDMATLSFGSDLFSELGPGPGRRELRDPASIP